jgi:hypothetical protein
MELCSKVIWKWIENGLYYSMEIDELLMLNKENLLTMAISGEKGFHTLDTWPLLPKSLLKVVSPNIFLISIFDKSSL